MGCSIYCSDRGGCRACDNGLVTCDGCGYQNDDSYDWVDTADGKTTCGAGCLDKLERERVSDIEAERGP